MRITEYMVNRHAEAVRLANAKTAIATAIEGKGVTVPDGTLLDGIAPLIESIETGGSSTPGTPGDITFYDYDGTIVTSWTLAELATKTALPDYPSHNGLICQGWNWSLADLKTANRKMNVGAMYITDDGKTRIYIHLEEGRTSPVLGVCPNGTVDVDWGDGTVHDTLTGSDTSTAVYTSAHSYAAPGDYVIQLTVTGSMGFSSNGLLTYASGSDNRNYVYKNAIQKVELGSGVTSIGGNALWNCNSLSSITIPNSVTSIGSDAFSSCFSLSSITIPNSVTSISGYAFRYCYSLSSITIPDGVTSINSDTFLDCRSLSSITIPDGVTSIKSNAFQKCYSLSSITIPDGVTSINSNAFYLCNSLSSITIPNSVTSIGSDAFNGCFSLSSITIPDGVTSIGSNAFNCCYGGAHLYFLPTTPPSVSSSNAFSNIPTDCVIHVPVGSLSAYTSATNYPSSSTYTYVEDIV